MRSLFLYGITDRQNASAFLDSVLAKVGDGEWSLGDEGRVFAWLRIEPGPDVHGDEGDEIIEPGPCIVADLSGAVPDRKADLVAFMKKAQSELGGALRDDGDALL